MFYTYHTRNQLIQAYRKGKLGITPEGLLELLSDLYEQSRKGTVFEFPSDDADTRQTCKWCKTSYRKSEQKDADRCPFCWRLI